MLGGQSLSCDFLAHAANVTRAKIPDSFFNGTKLLYEMIPLALLNILSQPFS